MYGKIHVCIKSLVLSRFDQETWTKILNKAEFNEATDFLMFKPYPDEKTFRLVGTVCEVSGLPLEKVLEVFGECWLEFCMDNGYDEMLRTLGGDFISFVQNLDALHAHLSRTYTELLYPSFRCEVNEDGTVTLHYYSKRVGLYFIVLGVIPRVAKVLYNKRATITLDHVDKQDLEKGVLDEHAIFTVKLTKLDGEELDKATLDGACIRPSVPKTNLIQSRQFCTIFPYHLVFDENFEIKQCGISIQILLHIRLMKGTQLSSLFTLTYPRLPMTMDNIKSFINSAFMLASIEKRNGHSLVLKGQMRWMSDIKHMIYIASPCISSLDELKAMNIYISDIPLYDVTRELILLNQQRMAEMEIAKKLDETTAALTTMSKALEIEKKKTDELLHEMLPSKVATAILAGKTVDAEKFECVTILFSDIVTFTNIASACTPMDIVNLLNNMYQRFDNLTTIHGVYKVETIGDAYMVVSGVPTRTDEHAVNVANFSLDMVVEGGKVQSPATGKPIQIRVGFHSGSVVAGVVGTKMPRYCLFGDTVNTSSRMESHGIPGRVHASPQATRLLIDKGYVFRDRGKNKIKGKGMMSTYILINRAGKSYTEPYDEYKSKPIAESVDLTIEVEVLPSKELKAPPAEKEKTQIKIENTEKEIPKASEPRKVSIQEKVETSEKEQVGREKSKSQRSISYAPIPARRRHKPIQHSSTCNMS